MYKLFVKAVLSISFIGFACSSSDFGQEITEPNRYFDLEDYFKKEAGKFKSLNMAITKTVEKNGESQVKNIAIKDWERELDFYIASDINKPDWKDSYQIDSSENLLQYRALDSALRTRYIRIEKGVNGVNVKHILISNRDDNLLYKSSETLNYFPDSLYEIYKVQQVKFLGLNSYRIKGLLSL